MPSKQQQPAPDPAIQAAETTSRRGLIGLIVAAVITVSGAIAVALINGWFGNGKTNPTPDSGLYRVRVTVINPQNVPVEDAKVWSSFGGEPKKVAGGWQFDIPAASKPQDSRVIFYASQENAFLAGNEAASLGKDFNPAVTIKLRHDESARVHGQVVDRSNRGVAGARVFVVGHDAEAVITKEGGNFDLPAYAAVDQQVSIHAEKAGYKGVNQWQPAGDSPAILRLEK
jgi:hypothetical protein